MVFDGHYHDSLASAFASALHCFVAIWAVDILRVEFDERRTTKEERRNGHAYFKGHLWPLSQTRAHLELTGWKYLDADTNTIQQTSCCRYSSILSFQIQTFNSCIPTPLPFSHPILYFLLRRPVGLSAQSLIINK